MAPSTREDKAWAYGWLLCGIPAMIAGFITGYRHDNPGIMVGTSIVAVLIIGINVPIVKE